MTSRLLWIKEVGDRVVPEEEDAASEFLKLDRICSSSFSSINGPLLLAPLVLLALSSGTTNREPPVIMLGLRFNLLPRL